MGYFLGKAGRDYVILERSQHAGDFLFWKSINALDCLILKFYINGKKFLLTLPSNLNYQKNGVY